MSLSAAGVLANLSVVAKQNLRPKSRPDRDPVIVLRKAKTKLWMSGRPIGSYPSSTVRISPEKCASSEGWHEQWVKVPSG